MPKVDIAERDKYVTMFVRALYSMAQNGGRGASCGVPNGEALQQAVVDSLAAMGIGAKIVSYGTYCMCETPEEVKGYPEQFTRADFKVSDFLRQHGVSSS